MYCKKCGKSNDNDAIFCKSCGARLNASNQAQTRTSSPPKMVKKKFPIKIVVAVLGIAVLAITAFLMLGKGSNKNYENVVEQYLDAGYSHDGKRFLSLFPNALVDEIYRRSGATKEDVRAYYSDMLSRHTGQPSFSNVKEGDKWSFSFEITKCYDYDDYDVQSYENSYQKHGVNLKIDAAKAVHYSLRLTQNSMERDIGRCALNLIQVGGYWYVNDYLTQEIFFWESFDNDGVRDFSEINRQKEGREDKDIIAEHLGCSTDNLSPAPDEMVDGEPHSMFYYVDNAAHRSDYRLFLLHDGNNARVMAYYPWTVSSTREAYSIPVEELPEGERDNNWKIKFADTAKQQEVTTSTTQQVPFSEISGVEVCADGHGPWFISIEFEQDGQFRGSYEGWTDDTYEYGTDNGYPTANTCEFHGCFSDLEQVDSYTYVMYMSSLEFDVPIGTEEIIEGNRYIYSEPWCLAANDMFYLYLPGRNTDDLPDQFLFQQQRQDYVSESTPLKLPGLGLYNITQDQGFSQVITD